MEINDFLGKTVISANTGRKFVIYEITAPTVRAWTEDKKIPGGRSCYCWDTINGDPISRGTLVFEDPSLKEPFIKAFNKYCRTRDAYWENYEYWMRKD